MQWALMLYQVILVLPPQTRHKEIPTAMQVKSKWTVQFWIFLNLLHVIYLELSRSSTKWIILPFATIGVHIIFRGFLHLQTSSIGTTILLKSHLNDSLPLMGKMLLIWQPMTLLAAHNCHIPMNSQSFFIASISFS